MFVNIFLAIVESFSTALVGLGLALYEPEFVVGDREAIKKGSSVIPFSFGVPIVLATIVISFIVLIVLCFKHKIRD